MSLFKRFLSGPKGLEDVFDKKQMERAREAVKPFKPFITPSFHLGCLNRQNRLGMTVLKAYTHLRPPTDLGRSSKEVWFIVKCMMETTARRLKMDPALSEHAVRFADNETAETRSGLYRNLAHWETPAPVIELIRKNFIFTCAASCWFAGLDDSMWAETVTKYLALMKLGNFPLTADGPQYDHMILYVFDDSAAG